MSRWVDVQIVVSLEANDSIVCEEDVQSLLDLCDQRLLDIKERLGGVGYKREVLTIGKSVDVRERS